MKNKFLLLGVVCFIAVGSYFFFNQETENSVEEIKVFTVEDLEESSGELIEEGDEVVVNFTMWLEDGTMFATTSEPSVFTLGTGQVIRGIEEGVLGARIGEKRKLKIPYNLAYGESGLVLSSGDVVVPPKTNFIIDIEILGVQ